MSTQIDLGQFEVLKQRDFEVCLDFILSVNDINTLHALLSRQSAFKSVRTTFDYYALPVSSEEYDYLEPLIAAGLLNGYSGRYNLTKRGKVVGDAIDGSFITVNQVNTQIVLIKLISFITELLNNNETRANILKLKRLSSRDNITLGEVINDILNEEVDFEDIGFVQSLKIVLKTFNTNIKLRNSLSKGNYSHLISRLNQYKATLSNSFKEFTEI